jgi:hypothetical protein
LSSVRRAKGFSFHHHFKDSETSRTSHSHSHSHYYKAFLHIPSSPVTAHLMYSARPLFGGAVTCDIKNDWRDVSEIRQVPDHQECFQEMDGAILVIEILERQEATDANAASFFFNDLAESNGGTENQFRSKPIPANTNPMNCVICAGTGIQNVAMGQEVRWVQVEICAFRLANVGTDLLLTVTKPIDSPSAPDSSFSDSFQRAVSTLQVRDWGLFG